MKKESGKSSKDSIFLKIAGISGIAIPFILILFLWGSSLLAGSSAALIVFSIIFLLLLFCGIIFFNYGFFIIGRKYESRSLKFASIAFIIWFLILVIVLGFITPKIVQLAQIYESKATSLGISLANIDQAGAESLLSALQQDAGFMSVAPFVSLFLGISVLVLIILLNIIGIFYALGIKKSGQPSNYPNMNMERFTGISMLSGIIAIIVSSILPLVTFGLSDSAKIIFTGISSIIGFIGLALLGIVYILQIMILFKESKK